MSLREFKGCWDRIYRAEAHCKELAKAWSEFLENEPYAVVLQMNDDGTGTLSVDYGHDALPDFFALQIGELLYHLRATLDASIYASAILESGQNPPPYEKNLEFPICDSFDDFKKSTWKIRPLSQERLSFIEQIQPYNVPELAPELKVFNLNRALSILNDWARKDRHRTLHAVGSYASSANPRFILPDGCYMRFLGVTYDGFLEHESLIAEFEIAGFAPGMEVQANPDLVIDIAVNETPEPCADNDILGTRLQAMIYATKVVVGTLERSFEKSR